MVSRPLWAAGPAELLQHGFLLVADQSDAKRRIAMILIDNAAELIMQTYLTLPKRITGIGLTRKERDEYCKNFPSLLDGIEEYAQDRIIGLNLGEFDWFHRLRNELYHQGNGLTVERRNLEVYAELCEKLFEALFDVSLDLEVPDNSSTKLIGEFFEAWMNIERNLAQGAPDGEKNGPMTNMIALHEQGELSAEIVETFAAIPIIRHQLVHGEAEVEEMLREENMRKIKAVEFAVGELSRRNQTRTSRTIG